MFVNCNICNWVEERSNNQQYNRQHVQSQRLDKFHLKQACTLSYEYQPNVESIKPLSSPTISAVELQCNV